MGIVTEPAATGTCETVSSAEAEPFQKAPVNTLNEQSLEIPQSADSSFEDVLAEATFPSTVDLNESLCARLPCGPASTSPSLRVVINTTNDSQSPRVEVRLEVAGEAEVQNLSPFGPATENGTCSLPAYTPSEVPNAEQTSTLAGCDIQMEPSASPVFPDAAASGCMIDRHEVHGVTTATTAAALDTLQTSTDVRLQPEMLSTELRTPTETTAHPVYEPSCALNKEQLSYAAEAVGFQDTNGVSTPDRHGEELDTHLVNVLDFGLPQLDLDTAVEMEQDLGTVPAQTFDTAVEMEQDLDTVPAPTFVVCDSHTEPEGGEKSTVLCSSKLVEPAAAVQHALFGNGSEANDLLIGDDKSTKKRSRETSPCGSDDNHGPPVGSKRTPTRKKEVSLYALQTGEVKCNFTLANAQLKSRMGESVLGQLSADVGGSTLNGGVSSPPEGQLIDIEPMLATPSASPAPSLTPTDGNAIENCNKCPRTEPKEAAPEPGPQPRILYSIEVHELESLRKELLCGVSAMKKGIRQPAVETNLQLLLYYLRFHTVKAERLKELRLVEIVRLLQQHPNWNVSHGATQLLHMGSWCEVFLHMTGQNTKPKAVTPAKSGSATKGTGRRGSKAPKTHFL